MTTTTSSPAWTASIASRLVGVQPVDLATREAGDDALVEPARHVRVGRLARRDDLVVDDASGEGWLLQQALEDRRGVGGGIGAHRRDSGCNRTDVRNGGSLDPSVNRTDDRLAVTALRLTPQLPVSYARGHARPPGPEAHDAPDADLDEQLDGAPAGRPSGGAVDLAALPIVGLTRRRMAILVGALLAAWIVVAFARQVADASEAATRAQDITIANASLRLEVAAMERELEAIGRQRFVEQQARAYGVGSSREIPFALAPDAPALGRRRAGVSGRAGRRRGRAHLPAGALAHGAVRPVGLRRRSRGGSAAPGASRGPAAEPASRRGSASNFLPEIRVVTLRQEHRIVRVVTPGYRCSQLPHRLAGLSPACIVIHRPGQVGRHIVPDSRGATIWQEIGAANRRPIPVDCPPGGHRTE